MFPKINDLRTIEIGTPGASRDKLVGLVLHGNKRATAGLLSEYEIEGESIEHVGELLAMVDNEGKHVGTLEVTRVDVLRFADVPDEFCTCRLSSPYFVRCDLVASQ
ncbi:MAG: ASCH domain-containing protein [Actinobacteria bacterium]|nr:ASCH domain-containing protein [Actinomycetota bacterium]